MARAPLPRQCRPSQSLTCAGERFAGGAAVRPLTCAGKLLHQQIRALFCKLDLEFRCLVLVPAFWSHAQLHVHYACFLPDSLTCQSCFRLALDPRCHIVSAWKLLKRLLGRWAFLQGRHADAYAQTLPDVDRGARWVDGYCYRESETPTGISRAAGRRPKTPADGPVSPHVWAPLGE